MPADEIRKLAARPDIDAVILTPHWGIEYQQQPDAQQRRLAHEAIDAGATAVIGSHPHVLEPWEKYTAADGREGLIVYSSGNFISGQVRTEQRAGLISLVELTRQADGKARLTAAGYVPTFVEFGGPWRVVENTGHESAELLASTLRLLPPYGKIRMHASALDQPPKACGVPVADAAPKPADTKPSKPDTAAPVAAPAARPAPPIKLASARPHIAKRASISTQRVITPVDPHQ